MSKHRFDAMHFVDLSTPNLQDRLDNWQTQLETLVEPHLVDEGSDTFRVNDAVPIEVTYAMYALNLIAHLRRAIAQNDCELAVRIAMLLQTFIGEIDSFVKTGKFGIDLKDMAWKHSESQSKRRRSKVTTAMLAEVNRLIRESVIEPKPACQRVSGDKKLNPEKLGWRAIYDQWNKPV